MVSTLRMSSLILNVLVILLQCSAVMPDRGTGRALLYDIAAEDEGPVGSSLIVRASKERLVDEPLLCGDNTIRNILHVDETFDMRKVMETRFQDAIDHANSYITRRRDEQEGTVRKLKDLEKRWYEASSTALAGKKELNDQDIRALFKQVVEGAYKSPDLAARSDCLGRPETNPDQEPYTLSQQNLKQKQDELLLENRVFPGNFDAVKGFCQEMVGASTANCDKLCNALTAIALAPSTVALKPSTESKDGSHDGSDDKSPGQLTKDVMAATDELMKVLSDIHSCEVVREGISAFKLQVDKETDHHESNEQQSRQVQVDLNQVLRQIAEFEKSTKTEEQLKVDLEAIIEKSQTEKTKLQTEADQNRRTSADVEKDVNEAKAAVQELKAVVLDAGKVVSAIHEFKTGMVVAMQSFVQVYNDTVRQPVAGLAALADRIKPDMWPNVADNSSSLWDTTKQSAGKLLQQCKAVAERTGKLCSDERPSDAPGAKIEAVCKSKQTLITECEAKLHGYEYVDEIRETIGKEQEKVKGWTQKLKAELENALSMTTVSKEKKAPEEPEYLRRFSRVFKESKLYTDYVAKWTAGSPDGTLLAMSKSLDTIARTITTKSETADKKLKEVSDHWSNLVQEGTRLAEELKNISSTMDDQQSKKRELDTKLQEHQQRLEQARKGQKQYETQIHTVAASTETLTSRLQQVFNDLKSAAHMAFVTPSP